MTNALDTLFYALKSFSQDLTSCSVYFANAQFTPDLGSIESSAIFLQQNFKPYTEVLEARGYDVSTEFPSQGEMYDLSLVPVPKNAIEARYVVAQALQCTKAGGRIFCAADNRAGGGRLKKMLQDFGVSGLQQDSRNKARVVTGVIEALNSEAIDAALHDGSVQNISEGDFISQPGVFSWDRIDKGSDILVRHLPSDLSGRVGDFGCGYGYLSRFLLRNCPDISYLVSIDADFRAVELCRSNLEEFDIEKEFVWADLRQFKSIRGLDVVVMNPPFHEGKAQDISLGISCIQAAAGSLRPGGVLYMVANSHLPYERVLGDFFAVCDMLHDGQGFKVFKAIL